MYAAVQQLPWLSRKCGPPPLILKIGASWTEVLISLAGMLRDQFADHFEVAEFLDRDVLKHVADAGVLDVERLHPILQGRGQFAGRAAELLQEIRAEARIGRPDIDGLDKLFAV